jgi:hypothetical protein
MKHKTTTQNKISPRDFLKRFKNRDREVVQLWAAFLQNLQRIRQQALPYFEEHYKILARLEGDAGEHAWLLYAGVEAMDETDLDAAHAALQRAYDLYFMKAPGGESDSESLIHEMQVDWEALSAASQRSLTHINFIKAEIVSQIPGSVVWRLWNPDLGELGALETRKLRAGWSQIRFSGYELAAESGKTQREAKHRQMQKIISLYYQSLARENIFEDITQSTLADMVEEKTQGQWRAWLRVPDVEYNRKIVRLWCRGWSVKKIAAEVRMKTSTIYNLISYLRRKYPEARIPRDRARRLNNP